MGVLIERPDTMQGGFAAGSAAKGEFRCTDCGYGVTVYRELPRCPMCGSESWEQLDRARAADALAAPAR
jgi:rubrerythrin